MKPVRFSDGEELALSRDIDKRNLWRRPGEARLDVSNARRESEWDCFEGAPDCRMPEFRQGGNMSYIIDNELGGRLE